MLSILATKNIRVVGKVIKVCRRTSAGGKIRENVVSSCFPDITMPKLTLPEYFAPYFDKYEKFVATECCVTKRKYTYGEIDRKSKNLSRALKKFWKLKDGDIVAVLLSNIPEYPIVNMGILKANLTLTTVSSVFTPDEISKQLVDANVKLVITEVDLFSRVNESMKKAAKILPVITVKTRNGQSLPNNTADFHEVVQTEIEYSDVTPWDSENVAALLYSSGTTGLPKGVQLTHNNLVANNIQQNHPEIRFLNEASGTFQEVFPTILPLYHAFAYNKAMNSAVTYGAKLVLLERFDQKSFITMLKEYQDSSYLCTVPPLFLMLTGNEDMKKDYLRNTRHVLCGAAPIAYSDQQRFLRKFGDHITVLQGYGLTEGTCVSSFTFPNVMKSIKGPTQGTAGIPVINSSFKVAEIDDPQAEPLGPGKAGEIFIKGPQIMKGYLDRPEDNKKCLSEDGWLRTGDIGYYNEEGLFFITDRLKEMIKVKAYQVAPAELEGIIRSFPGVAEAAVIGIPDKYSGELPRAYIVPKLDHSVDTNKLDEFVSEKVAKYKKLKGGIAVVEEMPKSGSGKILRKKLREEFLRTGI